MNFQELASQLIVSLRGEKSQAWVNQRLEANSNVIHRWEKGHANIPWEEYIDYLKVFKVDLESLIRSYYRFTGNYQNSSELLTHILSNRKLKEVEEASGLSSSKIRRLKNGDSSLNLADFLNIIFALDDMESLSLCYKLTDGNKIALLDERKEHFESISNKYHSNPNYGLILVCLNLPSYKKLSFHQDSFLSTISGIPIKEVNEILSDAEASGLIKKTETIYEINQFKISDRGTPEQMINSRKFWLQKALDNATDKSSQDVYGSIVFATTQQAREKIIARYLKFFEDFKEIVDSAPIDAKSINDEEVIPLIMNFQLFNPGAE
ncbi:MAG: hypothetical protein GY909_18855 [Oligoflexia bacterium]|nr:hypothetical protein [Oligoflexia bacterium]